MFIGQKSPKKTAMWTSYFQRSLSPSRMSLAVGSVESKLFFSSSEFRTGKYGQVTEDVVFKRIMYKENLRNSFLGAVLGKPVYSSEILDPSLNPIKEFESLRRVINSRRTVDLMKAISSGEKQPTVINKATNRPLHSLEVFLRDLSLGYQQLLRAIPSAERNTQLDIICQTEDGLINIEVQVEPQNFWDIRILSHVCGLFHKQFPRSFAWSQLQNDPHVSNKVRRAIGVSIFEKAPVHQSDVRDMLHWYDAKPWAEEEIRRHFQLTDDIDRESKRPGIEFFDFNLQAVFPQNSSLLQQPIALQEWLEFLAKAHLKQPGEIEAL